MGVRQPPDGEEDDETMVAFGIAALDARMDDAEVSFPATGEEIVAALGDPDVEYDPQGHAVALSEAVARADATDREFERRRHFMNALHPVFEDLRTSSAPGFVQWLRSLIPGGSA
jgi:hypothetical protein